MDEEILIDFPKDLQCLKKQISLYFKITENIINSINLCYNNSDSSILSIKTEQDFAIFLKKNISNLYLDISQNYDIYEQYLLSKDQNGDKSDLKKLNELISTFYLPLPEKENFILNKIYHILLFKSIYFVKR